MIKAPVTIDALLAEWSTDSVMDELEPGKELIRIPNLHSKYLSVMAHHDLIVKKLMVDYNKLKKVKWEYYSGDLNNPEDLEAYGFEPLMKKILRQDIPTYIESDEQLNKILMKKIVHQEIVDVCSSILKELNSRTWQLKSFIDWTKYNGGQ
jgi:hypothetical protein